jgi:tellurite resistance protein TehA-like permease
MFINKIKNTILYYFKRLFNIIIALFDLLGGVFIDIIITLIIFIFISLIIYSKSFIETLLTESNKINE